MDIKKILEEDPLYTEYKADLKLAEGLIEFNGSIDRFCPQCQNDSVFKTDRMRGVNLRGDSPFKDENLLRPKIISVEFHCSRNANHLAFVAFIQTEDKIKKAGQYPSTADANKPNLKKYRKEFPLDFDELRRAYGLSDHDVGIGAFIYLRRIFERRIKSAANRKENNNTTWDQEKLKTLRTDEKIDELADQLPEFLVKNKAVYSILSKGIHELTEEECLKYFNVLAKSIELLLEQELEIIEKENIEGDLSKEINAINQDITD